jgi:hypothetical protein
MTIQSESDIWKVKEFILKSNSSSISRKPKTFIPNTRTIMFPNTLINLQLQSKYYGSRGRPLCVFLFDSEKVTNAKRNYFALSPSHFYFVKIKMGNPKMTAHGFHKFD